MKGAKGGNRDRIISWLFSEKNRKKREEQLEEEIQEEEKIDAKRKERRKNKKKDTTIHDSSEEIKIQEDIDVEVINPIPSGNVDIETNEKNSDNTKVPNKDKKPPTISLDEDIVEELKERQKEITKVEVVEEQEEITTHRLFPVVEEVDLSNKDNVDTLEKPELLQVSIIEEIDNLLRNDAYDLRDIKYQIEVLNQQEKDEVLLENVEKIQKELEELIK